MSKKSTHYLNNEMFLQEMEKHVNACVSAEAKGKPKPKIPNYIGECFLKIAYNIAKMPRFATYPCIEEMIGDAIVDMVKCCENFNVEKSKNPFGYFSRVAYFAFLRRIKDEKEKLYAKYKQFESIGVLDGFEQMETESGGFTNQFEIYENISEFIQKYEKSMTEKKEKKSRKNRMEELIQEEVYESSQV